MWLKCRKASKNTWAISRAMKLIVHWRRGQEWTEINRLSLIMQRCWQLQHRKTPAILGQKVPRKSWRRCLTACWYWAKHVLPVKSFTRQRRYQWQRPFLGVSGYLHLHPSSWLSALREIWASKDCSFAQDLGMLPPYLKLDNLRRLVNLQTLLSLLSDTFRLIMTIEFISISIGSVINTSLSSLRSSPCVYPYHELGIGLRHYTDVLFNRERIIELSRRLGFTMLDVPNLTVDTNLHPIRFRICDYCRQVKYAAHRHWVLESAWIEAHKCKSGMGERGRAAECKLKCLLEEKAAKNHEVVAISVLRSGYCGCGSWTWKSCSPAFG